MLRDSAVQMFSLNETPEKLVIQSHWAFRGWRIAAWTPFALLLAIAIVVLAPRRAWGDLGACALAALPMALFILERSRWRRAELFLRPREAGRALLVHSGRWWLKETSFSRTQVETRLASKPQYRLGLRHRVSLASPAAEVQLTDWLEEAEAKQVGDAVVKWLSAALK